MQAITRKTCFVICPIGEPDSDIRKRANGVLDAIIRPALEPKGLVVERADHDKAPGIVTESIITKTIEADLVVADLTGHNPNVMYELALRHATGRPVVQIIEHGERLPFDISGVNTIFFRSTLDSVRNAVIDLGRAAEAAMSGEEHGNPIIRATEFVALSESKRSEAELVADALRELRQLAVEIRSGLSKKPPAWAEGTDADFNMHDLASRLEAYFQGRRIHGGISVRDIKAHRQYGGFAVFTEKDDDDAIVVVPFAPPAEVTKDVEAEARNELLRGLLKHYAAPDSA